MAFFLPYSYTHQAEATASIAPLLRLVDDLNASPRRGATGCRYVYRTSARPWQPRFNVRETNDAYVLHGELPGLNKDHVTVDFPEAQKLVVHGEVVERSYDANTAAAASQASDDQSATIDGAASDDTQSRSSHQATVEDYDETDDFEVVDGSSEKPQQQKAPAAEKKQKQPAEESRPQQAQEAATRQFTRTFTFPSPVNYDAVTADLKDGLLSIVVPKAQHEPHRVFVN